MQPSLPLLVRVLTRQQLKLEAKESQIIPRPLRGPIRSDKKRPALIHFLQQEKKRLGDKFPPNIRIEPILQRHVLQDVDRDIRKQILEIVKER